MKKFVICTNRRGIMLSEEHQEWLRTNGCPEVTIDSFNTDRTNPDLIACIEAVRASKQYLIDEAGRLWNAACEIKANNTHITALLSNEIDKTLDLLNYRPYMRGRIIGEMRKVVQDGNWMDATIYAGPKAGVDNSALRCQFGAVVDCFNLHRKEFQAEMGAFHAFHKYCDDNNLIQGKTCTYDDGFEIKSYDETRFVAEVGISYGDGRYDDDREFMNLKPFITEETVESFVKAGDTTGLMDYLASLRLNLDIRRNPKPIDTTASNNSDASMTDEEFAQLLAGFGILEGKAY